MSSVFQKLTLDIVLVFLLIFSVTGYFQYRAVRDLRAEIATARRTRKLRGYLFGLIGILSFAAMLQLMYILSLFDAYPRNWSGLLVWVTMGLVMLAFLIGNRSVGRIGR